MSHCSWGEPYHKTFGNFRGGPLVMYIKAVFGCSRQVSQFRKFLTSACAPKFLGRHMHRYTPPSSPTPPLFISPVKVCQAEVLSVPVAGQSWPNKVVVEWNPRLASTQPVGTIIWDQVGTQTTSCDHYLGPSPLTLLRQTRSKPNIC